MATPISDQPHSLFLGIAGGTASGKTSLSTWLAKHLGDRCLLISHDRYYYDVLNPIGHNYDAPESLDNARLIENLRQLRAGRPTDLPVYDFSSHSRLSETETVHPAPVIVVEGILILAIPEIRALFDRTIFVDAPEHLRLSRRIERDQQKRGRSREQVIAQYEQTVKPMHDRYVEPSRENVDLLLDGAGEFRKAAEALYAAVASYSESGSVDP